MIIQDNDGFAISYEQVRQHYREIDKFQLLARLVGHRNATKMLRAIGRLHTHYPGARTEMDYTKYAIWLYPNKYVDKPLLYFFGIGVDQDTTVIKGFTITVDPTSAHTIRLYRNCVLPKQLWLPDRLQHFAEHWDVFGVERLVAIDNAPDFRADATVLVWINLGVIVLLMPPGRPDMKGTVERTQWTLEMKQIMGLPGYVSSKFRITDPRSEEDRRRARLEAKLTVADFFDIAVPMCLEHNSLAHPRFKKQRILRWRDAMEMFPPILPAGILQNKTIFARTYPAQLTREGVELEGGLKYTSDALYDLFRTQGSNASVHVKLDDDDIRSVVVFDRKHNEPVVAQLTTHDIIDFPLTLELYRTAQRFGEAEAVKILPGMPDFGGYISEKVRQLAAGETVAPSGMTARKHAEAATQAAAAGTVFPRVTSEKTAPDLAALLRDTKL